MSLIASKREIGRSLLIKAMHHQTQAPNPGWGSNNLSFQCYYSSAPQVTAAFIPLQTSPYDSQVNSLLEISNFDLAMHD